jgi:hypothetical protein
MELIDSKRYVSAPGKAGLRTWLRIGPEKRPYRDVENSPSALWARFREQDSSGFGSVVLGV